MNTGQKITINTYDLIISISFLLLFLFLVLLSCLFLKFSILHHFGFADDVPFASSMHSMNCIMTSMLSPPSLSLLEIDYSSI